MRKRSLFLLSLFIILEAFSLRDSVLLRLKLKEGATYDYSTVFNQKVSMAGQPVSNMKMGSNMNLEVLNTFGKDSMLIRANLEHMSITISGMGRNQSFDSKNASHGGNPFYKIFSAMHNNPVVLKTNETGDILEIRGVNKVQKAVSDSMGESNPYMKNMINNFISEDAFRSRFTNMGIFPEKAVSVGDQWEKTISLNNVVDMNIHTTYTVKSIAPGEVVLEVKGLIASTKDSATINGMTVPAHVSGTQSGTYSVDPSTGLIASGNIDQIIKMKISMMGREMQMEMKGNSIITEKASR